MKCLNCGGDLQESDIYCGKCGTKVKNVENKITNKVPTISLVSLVFLIIGVLTFISGMILSSLDYSNKILDFVLYFPYILISLIIAIVGRVMNKDKLSLIVLIVDAILIILFVIFFIVTFFFFIHVISLIVEGCSYH